MLSLTFSKLDENGVCKSWVMKSALKWEWANDRSRSLRDFIWRALSNYFLCDNLSNERVQLE